MKKLLVIAGALALCLPFGAMAADAVTTQDAADARMRVEQARENLRNAQERVDQAERNLERTRTTLDRTDRSLDMARDRATDIKDQQDEATLRRLNRQEDKQTVGEYLDDAAITAKVKAKQVGQKGLDSLDIKVVTVDGKVTLMGEVDNAAQIGLAESTAKEVDGVMAVDNQLTVKK